MLTEATLSMVAATTLPVNNVKELIAYGKEHPGELNFASSGSGSRTREGRSHGTRRT